VKESFLQNDFFCIEMEYANGGSLAQLMQYHLIKMEVLPYKELLLIFFLILK
jgi:serine/threonine protein kinase